jgi:large subunit ribosomal protein L6
MSKISIKLQKKQLIKIPTNIKVFWCKKKKIILLKGPTGQKSLKLHKLIAINYIKQSIEIINDMPEKLSNRERKKSQSLKKTTISLIKQLLTEITAPLYRKLNLVGVGYRAFPVEGFENRLLLLRLGYSHPIYFKIPFDTNIFCLKLTKLFVYGHSHQQITFTASKIRLNKIPEPYKGKGILYENEKIVLKEGKKI